MAGEGILEIRTYELVPGERAEFDRVFREDVVPMLGRFGVRVVGFGPSAEADDAYVLLRAFRSPAARDEQEDRFYGSDEWVQRQREPVVSRIRSYHTVVLAPGAEAVDALAAGLAPDRPGGGLPR
jgi:hypothetical protein